MIILNDNLGESINDHSYFVNTLSIQFTQITLKSWSFFRLRVKILYPYPLIVKREHFSKEFFLGLSPGYYFGDAFSGFF